MDQHTPQFGDLEAGGLTVLAKMRLRDHAAHPDMHFTSEFSVPELLVTRAAGFEPIAQVSGCSVYHVGSPFQILNSTNLNYNYGAGGYIAQTFSGEIEVTVLAYDDAWRLALGRLEQQAKMIGAHGVVGLHVHQSVLPDEFAEDGTKASANQTRSRMIQLTLAGTAVRFPGVAPVEHPTLTSLTGQEFYALRRVGCYPVGFAVGVSVYNNAVFNYGGVNPMRSFVNMEMTEHTRTFHRARTHAIERVNASATSMGGAGVVDLKFDYDAHTREIEINEQSGYAVTVMFVCYGTVIAEAGAQPGEGPSYAVSLKDESTSAPIVGY